MPPVSWPSSKYRSGVITEPESLNCWFIVYWMIVLAMVPLAGTVSAGAWIVKSGMLFTVPS